MTLVLPRGYAKTVCANLATKGIQISENTVYMTKIGRVRNSLVMLELLDMSKEELERKRKIKQLEIELGQYDD